MRTRHVTLGGLVVASLVGVRPASAGDPWADGRPLPAITATTAVIHGVIRDQDGAGVPGATVVVSGSTLANQPGTITDEDGAYAFAALPPGNYKVAVYYADTTVEHPQVIATAGKRARVNLTIDTSAVAGEVIEIRHGADHRFGLHQEHPGARANVRGGPGRRRRQRGRRRRGQRLRQQLGRERLHGRRRLG